MLFFDRSPTSLHLPNERRGLALLNPYNSKHPQTKPNPKKGHLITMCPHNKSHQDYQDHFPNLKDY